MTTKRRRRVARAVAGLATVAAMTITPIPPAAAHVPNNVTTDALANAPVPIPTPKYYGAIAVAHDNGSVGKA